MLLIEYKMFISKYKMRKTYQSPLQTLTKSSSYNYSSVGGLNNFLFSINTLVKGGKWRNYHRD